MSDSSRFALSKRFTDQDKGFFSDIVGGQQIVRLVEIRQFDPAARNERIYLERLVTLWNRGCNLLGFENDVFSLTSLIAFDLVILVHRLVGFGIRVYPAQAMARLAIDKMQRNSARSRGGSVHRDRADDLRNL